jgi:group I intron endonuclease
VGSSTNLRTRFYKYYSIKNLSEKRTPIHNALLKYGYSNFSLVILEYTSENENPIKKEQYYLDLLKPEYNILETAGSSLGYKHSEETIKYFREKRIITDETRENLSIAARERILPQEVRDKISEKRKSIKLSEATRAKISESAIILRGVKVNITNLETNETLAFDNLTAAAKHVGVSRPAIAKALKNGSLIKSVFKVN